MISFLKKLAGRQPATQRGAHKANGGHASAMTLEERIRWREAMAYRSVRESMLKMEQLAGQYKLQIFPVDERAHRFVAIMDVADTFRPVYQGRRIGLPTAEAFVQDQARSLFGVRIDAIYWREHTGVRGFADSPARRGERGADTGRRAAAPGAASRADFAEPDPQELAAFRAALQAGERTSSMKLGGASYETELGGL